MPSTANTRARFLGSPLEHLLIVGTRETRCGKDATLAYRYPALTQTNSTDRVARRLCGDCREAPNGDAR